MREAVVRPDRTGTVEIVPVTRGRGDRTRTIGVVLVDANGARWQRTVDLERLVTVGTVTAGLLAATGVVASALRRWAPTSTGSRWVPAAGSASRAAGSRNPTGLDAHGGPSSFRPGPSTDDWSARTHRLRGRRGDALRGGVLRRRPRMQAEEARRPGLPRLPVAANSDERCACARSSSTGGLLRTCTWASRRSGGPDGAVCDHLVVMRRMPSARRLSRLMEAGMDVGGPVRALTGQFAAFHRRPDTMRVPPPKGPATLSGRAGKPASSRPGRLAARCSTPRRRLRSSGWRCATSRGGRRGSRRAVAAAWSGMASAICSRTTSSCCRTGPGTGLPGVRRSAEVVDGLDDAAFLAMDLERLGCRGLGRAFLDWYVEFAGTPRVASLEHHYVAYRAFVRAKVACLRADRATRTVPATPARTELAANHHPRAPSGWSGRRIAGDGQVHRGRRAGRPARGGTAALGPGAQGARWPRLEHLQRQATEPGSTGQRRRPRRMRPCSSTPRAARSGRDGGAGRVVGGREPAPRRSGRRRGHNRGHDRAALHRPTGAGERSAAGRAGTADPSDADARIAARMQSHFDPWASAVVLDTSGSKDQSLAAALAATGAMW